MQTDAYDPHLKPDEIMFKEQVLSGNIYDQLMALTGYSPEQRRKFKAAFFMSVLYGDNSENYSKVHPITKVFRKLYPSVWQFIIDAKTPDGRGKPEDSYKRLSQEMQRRESALMIGAVCGRLAKYHADIPVVTIHDSLMTPPQHVDLVERIILEEFERLGVRPQVKREGAADRKAA